MNQKSLIEIREVQELESILSHLKNRDSKFLLWQTLNGEKRFVQEGRLATISSQVEELVFFPKQGDFSFLPGSHVYLYTAHRSSIFKASILHLAGSKLVLNFPKKVMLQNTRLDPRNMYFTPGTLVQFRLNPKGQNDGLLLNSRLLDLSKGGLAFKSSLTNLINFRPGDRVLMNSPFGQKEMIEGEIRHITSIPQNQHHESHLRIGVKFLDSLS